MGLWVLSIVFFDVVGITLLLLPNGINVGSLAVVGLVDVSASFAFLTEGGFLVPVFLVRKTHGW
jgi:hypothetical protein